MEMYGNVERVLSESKTDMVCDNCGSSEITERAWVDYNTSAFKYSCDDGDIFCNECENYISPVTREEWEKNNLPPDMEVAGQA